MSWRSLPHCSSLLLEQGPKSVCSCFHLSIHCLHPEGALRVCHALVLLPGSLLWSAGILRRLQETCLPRVKPKIAHIQPANTSSLPPHSCQNRLHFASVLILKGKHSGQKKSMFSHWKMLVFFEKKKENSPKTQPYRDHIAGLQCLSGFFSRQVPQCGRASREEQPAESKSVQLRPKVFNFQVFCFTTGAAGHVSHKTEIVFHAVSVGMPRGTTGCQRHLPWLWSSARWKADANDVF